MSIRNTSEVINSGLLRLQLAKTAALLPSLRKNPGFCSSSRPIIFEGDYGFKGKVFSSGLFFLVILLSWLCFTNISYAQIPDGTSAPTISISPEYPDPLSNVTATLEAYTYDLSGATISWFVDGIEETDSRGAREITVPVGKKGSTLTISSQIKLASGRTIQATRTITPKRVDIVIEADTVVPLFYKGRALPSSGSTIRAVAIPDSTNSQSGFTYTWKLNNQTLFGGPLVGKDVAEFTVPFGGSVLLSVEVAERSGAVLAKKLIQIDTVKPQTLFYENNPLRGLTRSAISSPHQFIGEELTIRAEPYYMNRNIFSANSLIEWEINGRDIVNPSEDKQSITLRRAEGRGNFRVGFHIRNLDNLLQGTRDDFVVAF